MDAILAKIKRYLRQFIELGVLLLGVSVFAEILFGPNVAFFGSQVTKNLVELLNSLEILRFVFLVADDIPLIQMN